MPPPAYLSLLVLSALLLETSFVLARRLRVRLCVTSARRGAAPTDPTTTDRPNRPAPNRPTPSALERRRTTTPAADHYRQCTNAPHRIARLLTSRPAGGRPAPVPPLRLRLGDAARSRPTRVRRAELRRTGDTRDVAHQQLQQRELTASVDGRRLCGEHAHVGAGNLHRR